MNNELTVYLLMDDCPNDFGIPSILAVYSNKQRAYARLCCLRKHAPYECQYLTIVKMKVRV